MVSEAQLHAAEDMFLNCWPGELRTFAAVQPDPDHQSDFRQLLVCTLFRVETPEQEWGTFVIPRAFGTVGAALDHATRLAHRVRDRHNRAPDSRIRNIRVAHREIFDDETAGFLIVIANRSGTWEDIRVMQFNTTAIAIQVED
jgi:hypothetical protein